MLEGMTNEEVRKYISSMRGVGRWTAEYVLLRGWAESICFQGMMSAHRRICNVSSILLKNRPMKQSKPPHRHGNPMRDLSIFIYCWIICLRKVSYKQLSNGWVLQKGDAYFWKSLACAFGAITYHVRSPNLFGDITLQDKFTPLIASCTAIEGCPLDLLDQVGDRDISRAAFRAVEHRAAAKDSPAGH